MMMQSLSSYLGIWINDTTVCLFIDMMTGYLFAVSLTVYFRSNLSRPISKAVSGILAAAVVIAVGTAAVLQLSAAADMIVTSTYVNIIIGITAIAFMILLLSEVKGSRSTLLSTITWTPMILGLLADTFDRLIGLANSHFFTYSFAVTMKAQIVFIIFDLRKQRLEAIRYEQMQKELYEARV